MRYWDALQRIKERPGLRNFYGSYSPYDGQMNQSGRGSWETKPTAIRTHLVFVGLHDLPLLCRIPGWKMVVTGQCQGTITKDVRKGTRSACLAHQIPSLPRSLVDKDALRVWQRLKVQRGPRESRDSWDLTRLGRPKFPLENDVLGLSSQVIKECTAPTSHLTETQICLDRFSSSSHLKQRGSKWNWDLNFARYKRFGNVWFVYVGPTRGASKDQFFPLPQLGVGPRHMLGSSFKLSDEVSRMLQISGRIIFFGMPQSWVILGGDWASPSKWKRRIQTMTCFYTTPQKIKWLRIPSFIALEPPKIQSFHTLFDMCQVYFKAPPKKQEVSRSFLLTTIVV